MTARYQSGKALISLATNNHDDFSVFVPHGLRLV